MRYGFLLTVLVLLSILDIFVTYNIVGYSFDLEANPIMRFVLEQFSYIGLFLFKATFLAMITVFSNLSYYRLHIPLILLIVVYVYVLFPGVIILLG